MRKTAHTYRGGVAALIIAAAGAMACGDQMLPSAPALTPAAPSMEKGSDKLRLRAAILRRVRPLQADEASCRLIDPARARRETTVALRKAGLRVSFPSNSVSAPTRVCLTAHAGELLTYTFEPHGLHFNVPIVVHQDLHGTTAFHNPRLAEGMLAGYLLNGVSADVDADGVGQFEETFTTSVFDDGGVQTRTTPARASFSTLHFSGYALASGKTDTDSLRGR
ncbi:MAG: hypothetical protein ACJ8AD_16920 [Gemmatimonadaceae bacterium]